MFLAAVGETVPLHLVLGDGATGFFPRAVVYDGVAPVTTVDLAHVAGGYYEAPWVPAAEGQFSIVHTVYTDALHTLVASKYQRANDEVTVIPFALTGAQGVVRMSFTLDGPTNTITINTWLEVDTAPSTAGVVTCDLILYTSTGASLSTPPTQPSPDANGVFRFSFPAPAFAVGETPTYAISTIMQGSRTFRGITGITFSRPS